MTAPIRQRGYCVINIGGKLRTLHFSMNFWAVFEETSGYSISEIDKVFGNGISLSNIRLLVYSALVAYDQENGNDISYNIYQVGAWMDDVDADILQTLISTLLESRVLGNDLNAGMRRNVEKSTKNPKLRKP